MKTQDFERADGLVERTFQMNKGAGVRRFGLVGLGDVNGCGES